MKFRNMQGVVTATVRPAIAALVLALLASVLITAVDITPAGAADCSKWVSPNQGQLLKPSKIGTMNANVDVRRAPYADRACIRWDYKSGESVRVEGQSGDYYYVYNSDRGDYGWVTRSSVTFARYEQEARQQHDQVLDSSQNTAAPVANVRDSSKDDAFAAELDRRIREEKLADARRAAAGECPTFRTPTRAEYFHPEQHFTRKASATYKQRMGPSLHATCDRGARAYTGASLTVQARSGDWYYVYNQQNGLYGWVHVGVF